MRISREARNLCFEGGKCGRLQVHRVPKFAPDGIESESKFLPENLKPTRASRNRPAEIIPPSPPLKAKTPPPPQTPSSPPADATPNKNYAIIHTNDVAKAIQRNCLCRKCADNGYKKLMLKFNLWAEKEQEKDLEKLTEVALNKMPRKPNAYSRN